jgi:hypothetical protein
MGRFTLRDEGKTIAVGRVIKYKPYTKGAAGAAQMKNLNQNKPKEMVTQDNSGKKEDVVFNMETGEVSTKKDNSMPSIAEEEY